MSKKSILRGSAPHEVSLQEGSRDARSKSRAKPKEEAAPAEPLAPAKRMVRAPRTTAAPNDKAPAASAAPRKPRSKVRLADQVSAARADVSPISAPAAPPRVAPREPLPEHDLWATDSPVLHQLEQLRARNAQLSEQIQRLLQPGTRPGGLRK